MDKSSTTVIVSSSVVVLALFICLGIYISNQPQLHYIYLYSSSHPILALNLLVLLIIVSSHCFAISRNTNSDHLLSSADSTHQIINPFTHASPSPERVAQARTTKIKKQRTLDGTWNATKEEGSHLRQLKHSHSITQDNTGPSEMLTQRMNHEDTSSASSSSSSTKLRKEVSLTKEEVNRRVERFIRMFNDD